MYIAVTKAVKAKNMQTKFNLLQETDKSSSESMIAMFMKGVDICERPTIDPRTPKAVPTEFLSTTQGTAAKMAEQQIAKPKDIVTQKKLMTRQQIVVGHWVSGKIQSRICPTKDKDVLTTYKGRRVFGYLLIMMLKMIERTVRKEQGITKRSPASTQAILNRFTSKSLRLSLKEPRQIQVKKEDIIRTQKMQGNDFNSRMLKLSSYFRFYQTVVSSFLMVINESLSQSQCRFF